MNYWLLNTNTVQSGHAMGQTWDVGSAPSEVTGSHMIKKLADFIGGMWLTNMK
jgi:hypothetical protein